MSLPKFLTEPNPGIYWSNNYVVLDFETTNASKGSALDPKNRLVLSVWSLGPGHPRLQGGEASRFQASWSNEFGLGDLVQDIRDADFVVAHNAKFELQWLERCGLDLGRTLVWCSQIGDYVLGGNRWQYARLSLEKCAERRGWAGKVGLVSKLIKAGVCPSEIPKRWLLKYCVQDVALAERLFLDQRSELGREGLLPIQYTRCLLTPVLADIERNGMQLEPSAVSEKLLEVEREYAKLQEQMEEFSGTINWASGPQVQKYLYEELGFDELKGPGGRPLRTKPSKRFPQGQPKVDEDTILSLKAKTPKQRKFKKLFAEHQKQYYQLTKYLRKMGECCDEAKGVLMAEFNQTNTQTHRLSCTGRRFKIQLQNPPRKYKPLFKSRRPGWLVGEADGAQLEFRVAGHLGRCEVALADIESGKDVHLQTASVLNEVEESEVKSEQRQDAKADTFKPLYGGQKGTRAQERYYAFFREHYSGITETQRGWVDEVLEHKCLRTEWGMKFYWPYAKMSKTGYLKEEPSICNYPVQSFATADIIPIALVYFWHRIREQQCRMYIVNTVHDSIITELPPEEVEVFHALSEQCLIRDVYPYLSTVYGVDFTVPLGAGVKCATHWSGSDAEEYLPGQDFLDQADKVRGGEVTYIAEKDLYQSRIH
ncbi:MAG: DNA polymerase [Myxococcota bacterium]|nr:DNA polymerase [Myxococcota bacterium]